MSTQPEYPHMTTWERMSVEDVVKRWDAGDSVWSVEMGGLGPGYEQAIQVLIIELLRDYIGKPLPDAGSNAWSDWGDDTVHRVNDECRGFSGAQVGAAKSVAARMLKIGYAEALADMKRHDSERLIQISKHWPHAPEPSVA